VGKNVNITYFDDFNGKPLDAASVDTVHFSYRGNDFTLDLTAEDGAQFDADMARYIKAAKKAQARDARAAAKKPAKAARKSTATPKKAAPAPAKAVTKTVKAPTAPPKAATKAAKAATAPAKAAAKATKALPQREATSPAAGPAATTPAENRKIRQWAIANGRKVSLRGRISAEVIDAYHAAN
jgi:hypothetical protein